MLAMVVADACDPTYLAVAPYASIFAYRRSFKLLAPVIVSVMVTDACTPSYLAATATLIICIVYFEIHAQRDRQTDRQTDRTLFLY